jgi:glycosyltransferase involved in cell wall biosynthesis
VALGKSLDWLEHSEWRLWYQAWLFAAERALRGEKFDAVINVSLSTLLVYNPLFRANADVSLIAGTGPLDWPKAVPGPVRETLLIQGRALASRVSLPSLRRWDLVLPSNHTTHTWLMQNGISPCPVERDVGLWELPAPIRGRQQGGRVVTHSNSFFMPQKGLAQAIELFRDNPSLSLDIFGRDSAGTVARMLREAPPNVRWHGEVARDPLMKRLQQYDALLIPSLRESGGTPTVEALALGLPIVHFKGSGPGDLLGEQAGLSLTPDVSVAKREIRNLPRLIEQWTHERAAHNRARASENLWPRKAARVMALLFGPAPRRVAGVASSSTPVPTLQTV